MDVEKVFHMTGGVGKTSYARNSSLQKKASELVKHITIMTIRELYLSNAPKSLGIADLGCSTGHNTLSTIKDIVQAVEEISRKVLCPPPEFRVHLNDLPSNDFNTVFKALPEFYKELKGERSGECSSVYIAGYPGSFYGRVFPNNSLHFIYSSNCLHWLSKVPSGLYEKNVESINKGTIYISKASPPQVSEAYLKQFQEDFSLFLTLRSEELIEGGRMVLILLGREGQDHVDRGNSFFWELLTRSFNILVSQGDIEKEKLDSYDVHFYAPSKDEIMEQVKKEGSFEIDRIEMFELNKDEKEGKSYGAAVAMTVRAIQESMICHHFGEEILDVLFDNYARLIDEELAKEDISPIGFVLVLRKI